MKECFKCHQVKPISEFHIHSRMKDGHLNKCKECACRDTKEHYQRTKLQRVAYERRRFHKPERKKKILEYARNRRKKHPEKARAYNMVARAIRSGKLAKKPCEICGIVIKVQAHHDDYSQPLNVRWLCFRHHREDAHGQTVIEYPY